MNFSQKEKLKMKFRHVIVALAVSAAATFGPAYGQTTKDNPLERRSNRSRRGLPGA